MNDRQRDYFRAELLAWKDEILRESKITLQARTGDAGIGGARAETSEILPAFADSD
jgi:hypothetical protein